MWTGFLFLSWFFLQLYPWLVRIYFFYVGGRVIFVLLSYFAKLGWVILRSTGRGCLKCCREITALKKKMVQKCAPSQMDKMEMYVVDDWSDHEFV